VHYLPEVAAEASKVETSSPNQRNSSISSIRCLKLVAVFPSKASRTKRRQIPRPNVTVVHELGVCEEYEVECEACIWDMKQTWRFGVLGEGDLAEYLHDSPNSKGTQGILDLATENHATSSRWVSASVFIRYSLHSSISNTQDPIDYEEQSWAG